ncbi:hypothetical protein RSAG8_05896, partial [Rhizoctonia solani AG-8 WAC10335]
MTNRTCSRPYPPLAKFFMYSGFLVASVSMFSTFLGITILLHVYLIRFICQSSFWGGFFCWYHVLGNACLQPFRLSQLWSLSPFNREGRSDTLVNTTAWQGAK